MPFNYENYPDWNKRRNDFYKMQDTSKLSKTFIENFYRKLFSLIGFETVNYHTICREYHNDIDYLYYVGIELEKK